MLRKTVILSFILGFTFSTSAQVMGDGPCPDITPVEDFDGQMFSGNWIAYATTNSPSDLLQSKCLRYYFNEPKDGEWHIKRMEVDASDNSVHENEKSYPVDGPGRFVKESDGRKIIILATDYDNWGIIYSCLNKDNSRSETVHIFRRGFDVDMDNFETTVIDILKENDIYFDEIVLEDQHDCPID